MACHSVVAVKLIFMHGKARTFSCVIERDAGVFWRAKDLNIAFLQIFLIISSSEWKS